MVDVVAKAVRSRMMSGIRSKNTKPELVIRKGLSARGFRYRLHVAQLPGKPDIVLRRYDAAIFVHGCFWHGHECHLFKMPKSRTDFWRAKIAVNKNRDTNAVVTLIEKGWRVAEIWECAIKGKTRLAHGSIIDQLSKWIQSDRPFLSLSGQ